jgi:hypothetical protein
MFDLLESNIELLPLVCIHHVDVQITFCRTFLFIGTGNKNSGATNPLSYHMKFCTH